MSDLLKWAAVVDHSSPEVLAKLLHDQAAELVRLREVCRVEAAKLDDNVYPMLERGGVARSLVMGIACDLAAAGKEPTP